MSKATSGILKSRNRYAHAGYLLKQTVRNIPDHSVKAASIIWGDNMPGKNSVLQSSATANALSALKKGIIYLTPLANLPQIIPERETLWRGNYV